MRFIQWLIKEHGISNDFGNQIWYHGTNAFDQVITSGRLKTREEGARRVNAAALGLGIYLTNDINEAKSYVASGVSGGVVSVQIKNNLHFLRLRNTKEDNELFEKIRKIGLGDDPMSERGSPEKVNKALFAYDGVHWDLADGTQKIVVYNSANLGNIEAIAKSVPIPGTLNNKWIILPLLH